MKKLKKLIKESWLDDKKEETSTDQKKEFLEAVSKFHDYGKSIYREHDLKDVTKQIGELITTASELTISENESTPGWFDKMTINRHIKQIRESYKVFEKTAKEMTILQNRLDSSYDSIGEVLSKYFEINERIDDQLKEEDSAYQEFFRKALKKFGVKSPADLKSDEDKKKFFDYVDQNYSAKNESINETKFYAFWNKKKYEIEGTSLYNAKQKAIQQLKVPKSKEGTLAIMSAKSYDNEEFRYESKSTKLKSLIKEAMPTPKDDTDPMEYVTDFQLYIGKKYSNKKMFGGWEFDFDNRSGTISWIKDNKSLMMTPFWDGNPNTPVDVMDQDTGDNIMNSFKIPFKPAYDKNKDEQTYLKQVKQVISKLR